MNELFPSMSSKPEKIKIFALIPWSLWIFVVFPIYILPLLGVGLWEQVESSSWLEIGYHVMNGLAMLWLMWSYLREEWSMVTTDVRYYLKHIALTVVLMVGIELWLLSALHLCGFNIDYMREGLPVAEMFVSHTPLLLVRLEPIFGTIALSVFAPISICALFYCFGFAPVCYKKPWLAYLCVAVVALIPCIINILWHGEASLMMNAYFASLPIHLLACWSYQKTDNVWTPLVSLAITNLLLSLVQVFLQLAFFE